MVPKYSAETSGSPTSNMAMSRKFNINVILSPFIRMLWEKDLKMMQDSGMYVSISSSTDNLAYKRVGSMIHNGDNGRGIIGVMDLTDLMKDDKGLAWVHNNKQGFQDCEIYAELEKWLGARTDEYLDKYVNKLQLAKGGALHKPDHEWVQCDKCRKWRMLVAGFNSKTLPADWFCYMKPFNGRCDMPEQKVEDGVVTISEKRYRHNSCSEDSAESGSRSSKNAKTNAGSNDNAPSQSADSDEQLVSFKKCRRSTRTSKKIRLFSVAWRLKENN